LRHLRLNLFGNTTMQPAIEMTKEDWIDIGTLADIPRPGSRVVRTEQGDIAVFRTGDDAVFALLNRCPHKGGPLSEGIVYGHTVACPLHNWCLELATGQAVAPDEGCTPAYAVRLGDDGRVWLSTRPSA
jgi:nitrite reductase (NADH) small subunit